MLALRYQNGRLRGVLLVKHKVFAARRSIPNNDVASASELVKKKPKNGLLDCNGGDNPRKKLRESKQQGNAEQKEEPNIGNDKR